jgi:energy-converting hydrogenase Eha subunit A
MSFLSGFESKQEGVNDTVEFVVRVAIVTLSAVILVVVVALVAGLFLPNDVVESAAILDMVNPAFQTIIGAFVGLLGGLSLNANARDKVEPEPEPVEPERDPPPLDLTPKTYDNPQGTVFIDEPEEDDEMQPWEKYRNDLRYDANGDGVVDEDDFPDWRSAGK